MMRPSGKKVVFFVFLLLLVQVKTTVAQTDADVDITSADTPLIEGFIYFADVRQTALRSVKKRFAAGLTPHQLAVEIVRVLISGPAVAGLEPTWPKTAEVNALFITDDKRAIVDLRIPDMSTLNMDTRAELLAVYSLVNSLTVNIPEIETVRILINGDDADTLAGHIDLETDYKTNMLIVK